MITRLENDKYHLINPLVNADYVSIQLESVISGTNPGIIYVDSVDKPKTAAIYHYGEAGYYFVGDPDNANFNKHLQHFIEDQKNFLKKEGHDEFEFSGDSKAWEALIPSLFHPIKLNQSQQGIGYVALHKNTLVGRCLLDGQSNDLMGVGIAVKEAHRGKGLATLLASKTIEQIKNRGCSPYWECMDSNTASIKLAEKIGLQLAFTYKLFGFMI